MTAIIDHPLKPVPLKARSGPFTMGLLWITMVTAFPSVLIGFDWSKAGFSFSQVLCGSALSALALLCYALPAAHMAASTGLSFSALIARVFGKVGSHLVTLNLLWIFIGWYGLASLLMAEALHGLFAIPMPVSVLAVVCAFVMAANNYLGFKGVANFARYFAAPVLIFWVFSTFAKAVSLSPLEIFSQADIKPFSLALSSISSFIIGFAIWGNEPDYWRFGKPKLNASAWPLVAALSLGAILFPLTGWMLGKVSGIMDYAEATKYMTSYSFGGNAWLAILVLGASYFAANDSNLYGTTTAASSIFSLSHKRCVFILAALGAITTHYLSVSGTARALESIVSLNCVLLPTATVIVLCEWLWLKASKKDKLENVHPGELNWAALLSYIVGVSVGIATSGLVPALEFFHVGISSLQAWAAAALTYFVLRRLIKPQHQLVDSNPS